LPLEDLARQSLQISLASVAEPLKGFFSPALVKNIARDLTRVESTFPARSFVRRATTGLDELELLARAKHIAVALAAALPAEYPRALEVLLAALGPELEGDELLGVGMGPFIYLPYSMFIAEHGLGHFELSMRAQYELTKRLSAEWCVRPYIAEDPERAFAFFTLWAKDRNPYVRRLVSEGTRLRLPWGTRVAWLDDNPEQILLLLETLKDDPAPMVRRSVANNLNDLGKKYPELLTRTCAAWLKSGSSARSQLVQHALRSAVKRGEAGALSVLGVGQPPSIQVERPQLSAKRIQLGGSVKIRFELRSTSKKEQELLVDLVVHFVKSNGQTRPKVFKLKRLTLPPGASVGFESQVSFATMTTRRHYPGAHKLEVLINGRSFELAQLQVLP
jgi:3-methyladenine DNA glycosylase AlkC